MQFKRVKNRIQVLAYEGYDKTKKRAVVKMKGSLDAYSLQPSDGLIESLTVDEKEELQSYIEKERLSRNDSMLQSSTQYFDSRINNMSDSLTNGNPYMTDDIAVRLYASIDNLQKALRRAGYKRPAKAKVSAPADTRTGALPLDNDA